MTPDERRNRFNQYLDLLKQAHRDLHEEERRDDIQHYWTELMEFAAPEHREELARRIDNLNALMVGQLNFDWWVAFQAGYQSGMLGRPAIAPEGKPIPPHTMAVN
jgi:hypothetical protein